MNLLICSTVTILILFVVSSSGVAIPASPASATDTQQSTSVFSSVPKTPAQLQASALYYWERLKELRNHQYVSPVYNHPMVAGVRKMVFKPKPDATANKSAPGAGAMDVKTLGTGS